MVKRLPCLAEATVFQRVIEMIQEQIAANPKKELPCQVAVESLLNEKVVATLAWCKAESSSLKKLLEGLQSLRFYTETGVRIRTFGMANHRGKERPPIIKVLPLIKIKGK